MAPEAHLKESPNTGAFRNNLLTVFANLTVATWFVLRGQAGVTHMTGIDAVGLILICLGVMCLLVPPLLVRLRGIEAVKRSGRSVPPDMLVSAGTVALGIALLGGIDPLLAAALLVGAVSVSIFGGFLALRARRAPGG